MIKIHLCALLLAFGIAAPALADDWDASDAIGNRPATDESADSETGEAADEASDEAPALREGERGQSAVKSKSIDLDQEAAEKQRSSDPNRFSGTDSEGKRNVLGPLWGVPAGSPVMQNIDPEMEKQYAVNGEGRLAPKPDTEELEEQQREAQRAERDRVRAEERAAKEKRWAEEQAERQRQREAGRDERGKDGNQSQTDERQDDESTRDEPEAENDPEADREPEPQQDAASSDDADERETLQIGCRPDDE
jgi:colicin import membrane protein